MTRQITTVEELDKLPVGAIVTVEETWYGTQAAIKANTDDGHRWFTTLDAPSVGGAGDGYTSKQLWRIYGEDDTDGITLVHTPGEQARPLPHRDQIAQAIAGGYEPDHPVPNRHDYRAADAVLALFR